MLLLPETENWETKLRKTVKLYYSPFTFIEGVHT